MPRVLLLLLLVAGCLLAAGCETSGATPEDPRGEWELVELRRDGAVQPAPVGARATLTVTDREVGGTSYCNSYSGRYRIDGDELRLEGLGGTEMGCAPDLMAAETAYLEALRAVEHAGTADGYLLLTGPGVVLRYRPLPTVPASDLTGTRWMLETLLDGEVASSTTGAPAVLELAADGTLTASTGCRDLTGSWSLDGDVVHVSGLSTAGTCSADVAAQDAHVTEVLSTSFRVSVAGPSLTVTGPDGLGLVYRTG